MDPFELAIEDLRSQEHPLYRQTAKKWGVEHTKLWRRFKGQSLSNTEFHECQALLNNQQAQVLIDEINRLTARGTPPTVAMVRIFASNLSGKWPGINWASRFIKAHE